ncbi:hypothetical protein Tco_0873942 [Tanacetum coccineum]|uniref:Xylulose kinase-1 n=1 Tax=Tanacetum coccineum TaxID=301880 RepID=A0ABQ5BKL5_9ASTR
MAALKFASSHNMVVFLDKPTESDGFEQIVDFLNVHPIKYALTVNPTIYTACIEQFWATAKVKTVNEEVHIQALVDKKKIIITETSIRRDLQLADENGTECLPNASIFAELERMGAKTTAWNEFSSTMASAIICLAINQIFNFSKYIFDNMVKNLEGGVKFLMYPRFVQVFLDKQVERMSKHKKIYVTPSHTKKVFANMKRQGKDFFGRDTPLFQTMMVQAQKEGKGSVMPIVPQYTHTINQPSSSQPPKKQKPRKSKKQDTQDSQASGPTEHMADETENVESVPTHSNDPLLSGEDRLKLNELMELYTNLSQRVLDLENTKISQAEDASKQERKIVNIDADEEVTLINETQGRNDDLIATTTTVDELTLAQTLIEIKAAKPKAVTTAATTTTTVVTRPKARGVVVQEPSEFTTTTSQPSQLPQAKDKGKAKMVEPEKPLKKKDQILIDEEIAQRLQEELQAELEEEERLARQKEEDANIAEWDNVQAMIDADYELAARLQAQEQEELTIEERSKMFVELMDKRKKHFARLKAEDHDKAKVDDEAEMKKHMEIVSDDEVAIDAIPLATKPPIIVDCKIIKEGKMGYFQIIRADDSSRRYSSMIKML